MNTIFTFHNTRFLAQCVFSALLLIFIPPGLRSQERPFCGQAEVMEKWFKDHPADKARFEQLQREAAANQQTGSHNKLAPPTHTIPVVFHILHLGGAENISDAQIHDQMKLFPRMFQKQNPDTVNVVPSFTNNIANVQIDFQLATIDPDGNCTNGIIRHYTPKTVWNSSDFSNFMYTWPPSKYLNIYIVRSIDIAPAYSFLPGSGVPTNADVIVCQHNLCGSIGTANILNAWALGHEAAHWLSIPHIWGFSNAPGVTCGDDGITDTPITKGFTVCNLANTQICNPPIVENIQNYMDYSPCKIMFTNGQKAAMHACLNSPVNNRNNICSIGNMQATGITSVSANCIPKIELAAIPSATVCSGRAVSIGSFTFNANPTSYFWTANNNAVMSNPSAANPSFTFSSTGSSTITCTVSNANGSSSASVVVTVASGSPQVAYTYQESFETGIIPTNWTVQNPSTPAVLWDVKHGSASHGSQCVFMNAEDSPGGSLEILETPSYDFQNNPGAAFTFWYAYSRPNSTHKDLFKVQASKDCGGSWKDIYFPAISAFASASGGIKPPPYVPQQQDWKSYAVSQHPNFSTFLGEPNVIFRFYFQEDSAGGGNNIYLDQINFDSPVGINEFTKSIGLSLQPNPAQGEFTLGFTLSDEKKMKLRILNVSGATVAEQPETGYASGKHELRLNTQNELSRGIYFVETSINDFVVVKKLVVW